MSKTEDVITEAHRRWRLPGISCAVTVPGESARFVARGWAKLRDKLAVDEKTVFRVASISKALTAVAVMQLWERGCFGLDDPVNSHLKSYQLSRNDVTFRHLLTHTAGMRDNHTATSLVDPRQSKADLPDRGLPALREIYGSIQHVDASPGTQWAYCNQAFATLGQLVEDVSGQPFVDYMRAHVLEPSGMEHASFGRTDCEPGLIATGYRFAHWRHRLVQYTERTPTGSGALVCTTEDMAKFLQVLSGGGSPLLQSETLKAMVSPQYPPGRGLPAMGLAFWLVDIGSHLVAGHGGDIAGFKSAFRFMPGGPGVFIATNANRLPRLDFSLYIENLADRILGRLLGVGENAFDPVAAEASRWGELAGLYQPPRHYLANNRLWSLLGVELEIFPRKRTLRMRSSVLRRPVLLQTMDTDAPIFRVEIGEFVGSLDFETGSSYGANALRIRSSAGFATLYRGPFAGAGSRAHR